MTPREQAASILRERKARLTMSYTERFEADAEAFYRATGFMAPGKSMPAEMYQGEAHEARRQAAWDRWLGEQNLVFIESLEAGAQALDAGGWQPISTAPRDSTRILVFCPAVDRPAREIFEAWWAIPYENAPVSQGSWRYDGDKTMLSADVHGLGATHWQPLPATPGDHP